MTRRIRRNRDFEIILQLKHDDFLRTPREDQRNWLLNRSIREMADELIALHERTSDIVGGGVPVSLQDRTQALLSEQEIMEDWQIPVMQAMTDIVTASHGDVLEIGFGRGVAASMIQRSGVRSHTIVECNRNIITGFNSWREAFSGADIRLIEGRWQDTTDQLLDYDGILFHTYPLNETEFAEQVTQSVTFAAHFFSTASSHLREGGRFSYLTNEADSFSRAHQRELFKYFSSFTLSQITDLAIPEQTRDAHWTREMVIVQAVK